MTVDTVVVAVVDVSWVSPAKGSNQYTKMRGFAFGLGHGSKPQLSRTFTTTYTSDLGRLRWLQL